MNYFFLVLFLFPTPKLVLAQGSGNTLTFNGADEAIDLGDLVANDIRTIEMWFKPHNDINPSLNAPITLIARDFNGGNILSKNEFAVCFYPTPWGNGGKLAFIRRAGSILHVIFSNSDFWEADH